MKKPRILIALVVMTLILVGIASVSYALEAKSNAEIVAGLTGQSIDDVNKAREAGESYGEQAAEVDKLEAFKTARQEQMKARLDELVEEDRLTREQADERLDAMTARMNDCDGTGENQGQRGGLGDGTGCGLGGGMRNGNGLRDGQGAGMGGRGMRAGRSA